MLRAGASGASALFVVLLLGACGTGGQPSTESTTKYVAGGTAIIRTSGDFGTFDPHKQPALQTRMLVGLAYESLTVPGPNGTVLPYLAKSWTATPTQITFTIRNDSTCADGTPVTPTVVRNSLQRNIDLPSQYNTTNWGPGPYSVTADDAAGTVTFKVGTPFSDLGYGFGLGLNETDIICPAGLKSPELLATQTFGSGPYQILSATHGDQVVMKLRKDWRSGPAGITASTRGLPDTLVFKQVTNETTAANLLLTGGLNVATVTGSDLERLLAEKNLRVAQTFATAAIVMTYNETPGKPTADERVREALSTALDRKGWLQGANNGHGKVANAYAAPNTPCYQNLSGSFPSSSLTKAQQILEGDGYSLVNGKIQKNGQPLTIHYVGATTYNAGPDYVIGQWQKLGVTVVPTVTDYANFAVALQASNYDAMVAPIQDAVPPGRAALRLSGPPPPKGTNFGHIDDPALEQERAMAWSTTGAESCRHWNAFWRELLDKHHILPMTWDLQYSFARDFEWAAGGASPIPMARDFGLLNLRRVKAAT